MWGDILTHIGMHHTTLTISMDEGVCAPSEILSPLEVLATVSCDASVLTPLTASNV